MVVLLNGTYWSNNIHCDIKHELLHVLNGNMTIECSDGRKYPLQSGDILLIPSGMKHRDVFNSASELKLQLIHFSLENEDDFFGAVKLDKLRSLSENTRSEIKYILSRIRTDLGSETADILVNECRLNTILQLILRAFANGQQIEHNDQRKLRAPDLVRNPVKLGAAARHYVECNFAGQITLTSVARHFNVSNGYFSHLFRQENGESFIAYLTDLRMREAERLLRDSAMNVSEIARSVGFENPNYFTRIFQKRYGLPPSDYREKTFADVRYNK